MDSRATNIVNNQSAITEHGRAALAELEPIYQVILQAFRALDSDKLEQLEVLLQRLLGRIAEMEHA